MLMKIVLLAFLGYTSAQTLSREDAFKNFCSPIARRKLSGSNIYHLKFKNFNKKTNLEDCAAMTLQLGGKSFDFWLLGCYINVDDTSTTYLKRSLRYSYYELSNGTSTICSPENHRNNGVTIAPHYGYPLICKRKTRRDVDGDVDGDCAPPPYHYPPAYSEAFLPSYGSLYESYEESHKIANHIRNEKPETFHSVFFETADFNCDVSITNYSFVVNCVDPRMPESKPSKEYNCLVTNFDPTRMVGKFKVFGDDAETGRAVLEEYKFHTPPAFCPPPNALIDYHESVLLKMAYPDSQSSGRVMFPLLLHQKEGQPNVLLSTAVHQALLMRDKTKFYFDDDYLTVWHDSYYVPISFFRAYRTGGSCRSLSLATLQSVFYTGVLSFITKTDTKLKEKYPHLFEDLETRSQEKTTIEDYLIILRKELKPWVAYEFVKFLVSEKHGVTRHLSGCDSYEGGFKRMLPVPLTSQSNKEIAKIVKYLKTGETLEQDSLIEFSSHKCRWIVNYKAPSHPELKRRFKMNCEDPRTPAAGPSKDYNCMYSIYDGPIAVVNVIGSASTEMDDSMGERIIAKYKKDLMTLPDLCPPVKQLLSFHDRIRKRFGIFKSILRDSSVRNLITGRAVGERNYVIEVNLFNALFGSGHQYASEAVGYRQRSLSQSDIEYNERIENACKALADFKLSALYQELQLRVSNNEEFQYFYKDMEDRGFFGYTSFLWDTSVRRYVNTLKQENKPEVLFQFFEYIKTTARLKDLILECVKGGYMIKRT